MMTLFSSHPGHRAKPRRSAQGETPSVLAEAAPVAPLPAPVPEAPAPRPEEGARPLSWGMSLEEAGAAVTAASRELDGEQEQAARDFDARWPAIVTDGIMTDGDDEPLPRRVPGATLRPAPEPASPADELAAVLDADEMPGADDLRRIVKGLRSYNPHARGATMPNPALRESRPLPALREPASAPVTAPVPGAAFLLSFCRTGPTVVQPLDGLPERRTASGKPVIHLGDDPRNDGEAFAIGRMPDAYLDGLIAVLMEEKSERLKARGGTTGAQPSLAAPAFTPRREGAA